jgi:WD40 repeat protein
MSWPRSTDYFEAVQNPRSCMSDEELRAGRAALDGRGLPLLWSGNFADVYKIECPATGNTWALKCFTREVADQRQRYRKISVHLDRAKLPFTVDFQYLESGIRIAGRWHPALKMRWVEGLGLNQFVDKYVDKPKTLDQLLGLWPKLAQRLRKARMAHADLQHGNVLLVPMPRGQLALRLIDYDGMYVPALSGRPSGELGHPAYQHPQRLREGTYSAEVDRFSHLAIYCAVRCVRVGRRELWRQFDNGDNLLFRESDFRNPGESSLFRTLWTLPDADVRALVGRLALACQSPLEASPLLDEILVRGDGKVVPLDAREESAVKSLLAPKPEPAAPIAGVATAVAEPPAVEPEQSAVEPQAVFDEGTLLAWASEEVESPPLRGFSRKNGGVLRAAVALGYRKVFPVIGRVLSATARAGVASLRAVDRLLLAMAGRENTILYSFLRVITAAALVAVVAIGAGVLHRHWRTGKADDENRWGSFEAAVSNGLDLGEGVKIEFVRIPAGSFTMGDGDGYFDERPAHDVRITQPFWLGKYEVTQEQWQAVMRNNPSERKDPKKPVHNTSWEDCQAFVRKLNARFAGTGAKFGLPTEAQWEYACRAGGASHFSFGDDAGQLAEYAWFEGNSDNKTHPVGEKKPNAWGLCDMHGNVLEWCADWYDKSYYEQSPVEDPAGPSSGLFRVCRGGNWNSDAFICRTAFRYIRSPTRPDGDCGLRVTCGRAETAKFGTQIRAFMGHDGVFTVAFSPDGRRVLTGSFDKTAILWNADTGDQIRILKGHDGRVASVAFSPDGKRVLTGSEDCAAILWDASTGKQIRVFKWRWPVYSVAFRPDGKRVLAQGPDYTAVLWEADTGNQVRAFKGHDNFVHSVAFSPDGKRVLTGSLDKTAILWDADTGNQVRAFKGHDNLVRSVAFSPDGKRVLTGSYDHTAVLWDADTGKQIRAFRGHNQPIPSVAFSPDGKRVLTGSYDHTAVLWDVGTGSQLRTFAGHTGALYSVAFSPDGKRVLTGSKDHSAILWDTDVAESAPEYLPGFMGEYFLGHNLDRRLAAHVDPIVSLDWAGKNPQIVPREHFSIRWTGVIVAPKEGRYVLTINSDDGHRLRVDGEPIMDCWKEGANLQSVATVLLGDKPHAICIEYFQNGGPESIVFRWRQEGSSQDQDVPLGVLFHIRGPLDERKTTLVGHTALVQSVAFSPDGKTLVSGGHDGTVRLWDVSAY